MIVVLTCPRPAGADYLGGTVEDVDSSATEKRKVIVADAPSFDLPPGWEGRGWSASLVTKPAAARPRENKWAFWHALELALVVGEDLLFFEDDVRASPRAVLYAETLPVPADCAVVSLYAPWGDATHMPGIWRMHASNFSFCQALKIPARTVRALVDARAEMEASPQGGSDEMVREIGERRDWLVGFHLPGLFQHVGAESAVMGAREALGTGRSSRAWAADIDAFRFRSGRDYYR